MKSQNGKYSQKSKYRLNIKVKHYVNNKLKPKPIIYSNSLVYAYPLYVQVIVKGQTTRFRSILNAHIPEDKFEFFKSKFFGDILAEERIIKRVIYEMEDIENQDFKLKWTGLDEQKFSYELDKIVIGELTNIVHNALSSAIRHKMSPLIEEWHKAEYTKDKLIAESEDEFEWLEAESGEIPFDKLQPVIQDSLNTRAFFQEKLYAPQDSNNLDPYYWFNVDPFSKNFDYNSEIVNFYSLFFRDYIPGFRELRDSFCSELWDFPAYIRKIKRDQGSLIFTIDEWVCGDFNFKFLESWHDEAALSRINNDISKLINLNSELKSFIYKYPPFLTMPHD